MSSINLKTILGIETSCDETGAAICHKTDTGIELISNIVSSSLEIQAKYGGVIPEQAAREQIKAIIPVIKETLAHYDNNISKIDAIAVTKGPGLIGSLLVGVETAKTLSLIWNKPLIEVNHLLAHFYANWIDTNRNNNTQPIFPIIGLLVSGGHTDLILMKSHKDYLYLGGTRDDAAGEAFDKTARLLGLKYPGGPELSKLAIDGDPNSFKVARPMMNTLDYDFSFSGLKTSVLNIIKDKKSELTDNDKKNLAASIQEAIVDVLVKKTISAANNFHVPRIMIAGGVSANQKLRKKLEENFEGHLYLPQINLSTDNAAIIAATAFFQPKIIKPISLQAAPNLSLLD